MRIEIAQALRLRVKDEHQVKELTKLIMEIIAVERANEWHKMIETIEDIKTEYGK